MALLLDHIIFGNGRGMSSPYHDNRFYWLVDTNREERSGRNGRLYTFLHGFGAQLISREWFAPREGEIRELAGRRFKVFHHTRKRLRVEIAWAMIDLPRDIDAAHSAIDALEKDLGRTP